MNGLHFKRFSRIQRATASALRLFTKTQRKLERQQAKLQDAISMMESEASQLTQLASVAKSHHAANDAVLTNIQTILNGTSGTSEAK